jgi:hypothetical protein
MGCWQASGIQGPFSFRQRTGRWLRAWLALAACAGLTACGSDPKPEPQPLSTDAVPAPAILPDEPALDPTEQDIPEPPFAYQTRDTAEPVRPRAEDEDPTAVHEADTSARFWYSDVPDDEAGQRRLHQEVTREHRDLEAEVARLRKELLDNDPYLSDLQSSLRTLREERRAFVAATDEMVALPAVQAEERELYERLGRELEAMAEKLQEEGVFDAAKIHVRAPGCCAAHLNMEPAEETPLDIYMTKLGERRAVLQQIARHSRQQGELAQELAAVYPELQRMDERMAAVQAEIDEAIARDPEIRAAERSARRLNNKRLYLGRVLMGDTRYYRPADVN